MKLMIDDTGSYGVFKCPGCKDYHRVSIKGAGCWGFNGDQDKPTLTPSVLVTYPAVEDPAEGFEEWREKRTCHSFVSEGKIQFLSDCWHELANQTVELIDL